MRTTRGKPEQHITRRHPVAANDSCFFDDPHGEARQVVFAIGIHARHLGCFTADQRAARLFTAAGNTAHHTRGGIHIQPATSEVVQKKQRLGALHQNVIDAHGDQINAHGVMTIEGEREFELGAHAVGARHQNGFAIALGHFEERAESPNAREHAVAQGPPGKRLDSVDQRIAGINIHSGVFVR